PLTISDAEAKQMASGMSDLQKVRSLLESFVNLFAGSGMPSESQLRSSGIFDTGENFMMSGANFDQFASDVSTEDEMMGVKLGTTDIRFIDANNAVVDMRLNFADGAYDQVQLKVARSGADQPWRITGDGRILDVSVESMSVQNHVNTPDNVSRTSGIQVYAEVDYYQVNNPTSLLTHIVVTGPGLPESGAEFHVKPGLQYLGLGTAAEVTDSNMISECAAVAL